MPDLLSAIGDIAGSVPGLGLIGGATNLIGGILSNEASAGSIRQQEQFQAEMSNTAYQRSMNSMRDAGLNPILAYQQGGASTPTGASMQFPNVLGGASSSALSAMQTGQQMDSTQANIANTNAKTNLLNAQARSLISSAGSAATSKSAKAIMDTADSAPYKTWFGQHVLPWWDVLTGHISNTAKAVEGVGASVAPLLAE